MIFNGVIFSKIGGMAFYSFLLFTFIGEVHIDRKLHYEKKPYKANREGRSLGPQ